MTEIYIQTVLTFFWQKIRETNVLKLIADLTKYFSGESKFLIFFHTVRTYCDTAL